jgi:hypothetical protein
LTSCGCVATDVDVNEDANAVGRAFGVGSVPFPVLVFAFEGCYHHHRLLSDLGR